MINNGQSKKIIFFLICLISVFSFAQDLKLIKKQVAEINITKNFVVKVVSNDYFVDVKNEVTDNGQELKGFFKNNELCKMVHEVGLSSTKIVMEYYFQKGKLIFVHETNYQTIDEKGFLKNPNIISEGRYYFKNQKIIKKIRSKNPSENKINFVEESKILRNILKN